MSNLELADALKAEVQVLNEQISQLTRRRNILGHYTTRLRLGVHPDVVRAEILATGEALPAGLDAP